MSSQCALQMYEVHQNIFNRYQVIERTLFCDRQTEGRTLLQLDSWWVPTVLEKVAKKALGTQQILGYFYGINLILRNFRNLKYPSRSIREYGWTDTRVKTICLPTLKGGDITNK